MSYAEHFEMECAGVCNEVGKDWDHLISTEWFSTGIKTLCNRLHRDECIIVIEMDASLYLYSILCTVCHCTCTQMQIK